MTDADAIGSDVAARWRRLRERSGCPTPFSHEHVVRGIAQAAGLRVASVFRDVEGHEAGCLLYVRRRGPLSQVVVPPFCFYSAVILPDNAPDELRGALLLKLLDGIRAVSPDANVVLPPGTQLPAGLHLPAPWRRSEFRTYRSGVNNVDEAIRDWSSGSRSRYRKHAEDFGVETGTDIVPSILAHVERAYVTHGRGLPIPRARLKTLIEHLVAAGHARIVGLREPDSGRVVAGIVLILDGATAWDWIAGSERGPGMTVCIGRAMEQLHELGVTTLDFGGANVEAIATFKRQFGGDEVTYPTLDTPQRPLVRWMSSLKGLIAGGA